MNGDVSDRTRPAERTAGTVGPRFMAEVSSNHHRDLGRCLAFVDAAAAIGCDAIKFQLFRVRELFAPEILAASAPHRERAQWELPIAYLEPLAERARAHGLLFACTPFDLDAVATLAPFVDLYKIGSYELLWHELLAACAARDRPVVLSTGMADEPEVAAAFEVLARSGAREVGLLHCVSAYPTPPAEANLAAMERLRALGRAHPEVRISVGWSDHSVEPGVIHRAVHRFGAEWIEFHLDLEGRGAEYAAGHCWLPREIGEVIRAVRVAMVADGVADKRPAASELAERDWRADPGDGLRPFQHVRTGFVG